MMVGMDAAPALRQAPRSRKPWPRRAWRGLLGLLRGALLLEDTPERIARGCAFGVATAFLPMFGQSLLGALLARLCGGNVIAALPWTWISNPLTTVPIWYGCYRFGALLVPGHQAVGWEVMTVTAARLEAASWSQALADLGGLLGAMAWPLILGTVLVGGFSGFLTWLGVRPLVARWQERRRTRHRRWLGDAHHG